MARSSSAETESTWLGIRKRLKRLRIHRHQSKEPPSEPSEQAEKHEDVAPTDLAGPAPPDPSIDLWSAAYREAVKSLGDGINVAILKGESVAELFRQLENLEKDTAAESAFLRGVKYLQSLQVPLERFKLALDLATPLTNLEPATSAVCGVVQCVTAIAISLAAADLTFAKQIGDMLEQLSYIDECDTLGQKTNKESIHKALVSVYRSLLQFYNEAFQMLTKKGAKLVLALVLENGRLPGIVAEFLKQTEGLRRLVENATLEIVDDIRRMLFDAEIVRWLGSEKISRQNQHHAYLQELRSDQACEFLLKSDSFTKWYQASGPDARQLAILGHMGSGKSVAMAFLVDELRRRNERQLPQPKICYHYCRDDGSGQAVHVFSALILSLLEQLPGLKRSFVEWFQQKKSLGIDPATNPRELESWLERTVKTIDRQLFFAVDGLDECDRQSRNHLLRSFRSLSESAPRLRILMASRPEEEIVKQLERAVTISMPRDDALRDRLIAEKTVEHRLCYLSPEVKSLVTDTLSESAQGSAIWTKMTVDLIEARGIRAAGPMRAFLAKIPQSAKLSELYTNLFSHYTRYDPESQRLATVALEVLAAARRPLSILELAWATTLGTTQDAVPDVATLADLVDHQRIMSLIQPFVVHVDFGDLKKPQVKLVHQSVKEFIVNHWASNQPGSEIVEPAAAPPGDQAMVHQRMERLEAGLLRICIRYLLLQDMDKLHLLSEEQQAMIDLPHNPSVFAADSDDEVSEYDPQAPWEVWETEEGVPRFDPTVRGFGELFVYASCFWVEHLAAVSAESLLPPLQDIELLCRAGSTRLSNWTAQNDRPNCTVKPRYLLESVTSQAPWDPLVVTAIHGSRAMFHRVLDHSDLLDTSHYLPNTAVVAANRIMQYQTAELPRLKLLWSSKVGRQIQTDDFFYSVVDNWDRTAYSRFRPGWDAVFGLIDDMSDKMIEERWGNGLLLVAARRNCLPLTRRLMDNARRHPGLKAELLDQVRFGHGAVGEAVFSNHVETVEYLLSQPGMDAQLRHRNERGENLLHLASQRCNPAVFRLLVPHLKGRIHEKDKDGLSVVMRIIGSPATTQSRHEVLRILLGEPGAWSKEEQEDACRFAEEVGAVGLRDTLMTFTPKPA
ncbi:hypothetical protein VTK26DRAFT_4122 [Humicola hyalothermophila]